MKKIVYMALSLLLLVPAGAWAEETPSFVIDAQHVYPGMEMSYAQGYIPTVQNGAAQVVLPVMLKGNASCDNITASVDLGEAAGSPFVYKNYVNTFPYQRYELEGGRVSCCLVRFSLELSPGRVNGNYPIRIDVEGVTKGGVKVAQQVPLYIVVRDGKAPIPDASLPQPKLMVKSCEYSPHPLQAGEEGTLTIVVTNTGASQSARNIMLCFQDSEGGILPADTGSVYIPEIGKGKSVSCDLAVRVTEKAAPGPHTVSISMAYEDESAASLTAEDTVVLDIEQPLRLEYEQPSLPGKVTEGDNLAFSINLMNLGKGMVCNVLVTFEIPGLNNGGSVLVGNIEPGKAAPAKTNLRVGAMDGRYGETSGRIILTYENEAGEVFTREMEVHTVIEEKIHVIPTVGEEDGTKSLTVPWWGIVIAAIVLLGIIGMITAKTIKTGKERKADELRL